MNNLRNAALIFLLAILCGCQNKPEVLCPKTGFTDSAVCPVSFFQVLGNKDFESKTVRVSGYLSERQIKGMPRNFLFFSEEQANISNYHGAIELVGFSSLLKSSRRDAYRKTLIQRKNSYVEVIGELSYSDITGMDQAPAEIKNIVGVREIP